MQKKADVMNYPSQIKSFIWLPEKELPLIDARQCFNSTKHSTSINLDMMMCTPGNFVKKPETNAISYIEICGGRRIRHKLDFNSPRTAEAAALLGITFEDCLYKLVIHYLK